MAMDTEATPVAAGVVGAGLIGRAWAIVFARAGWQVRLYDRLFEQNLANSAAATAAIAATLADMQDAGLLDEPLATIAARITPVATLGEACADAALVQENIAEDVTVKQTVFAAMDALAPPEAVLASSTSWLPASRFTEGLPGRQRCLVAHPTNPPNLVPLVEVCPAPWTADEVCQRAMACYAAVGQQPVLVKREIAGFLLNRIQGAVLNEMLNLFEDGVASAADLDRVMTHGLALRWSFMGPFETIDLNAPDGVIDYARRYGPSYVQLGQTQRGNDWSAETLARLEAERRHTARSSTGRTGALARCAVDGVKFATSNRPGVNSNGYQRQGFTCTRYRRCRRHRIGDSRDLRQRRCARAPVRRQRRRLGHRRGAFTRRDLQPHRRCRRGGGGHHV